MDAYLCALLDGHHKTVAAALEGHQPRCLTILPVSSYFYSPSGSDKKVWIGGVQLDIKDLPTREVGDIANRFGKSNRFSTEETERYLAMESKCWDDICWPTELVEIGNNYPDVLGLACIKIAGDLSSERIERLLRGEEKEWEEKLDFVLRALIALKDKQATKLSLAIGRNEGLKELWDVAFKHLATIQSEVIEDFFINFLIGDDKRHPHLTKIADEYLIQRG